MRAALVVLVVAALLSGNALAELPWLRVGKAVDGTPRLHIVDDAGRVAILRGVNVELDQRDVQDHEHDPSAYDGKCPPNANTYNDPPICEIDAGKGKYAQSTDYASGNDFAQMRALGFNVIRLCLSWSQLEPTPGVYDSVFLSRVAQVVSWAKEQDIYVILDMHEDLYSRFIFGDVTREQPPYLVACDGQDGAPAWAVPIHPMWPALCVMGQGNFNLAMMYAFDLFYDNADAGVEQGDAPGRGLQDHYIGAIAALARTFINESTVIGFEIMNEPQPGTHLEPFGFAAKYLYPFYKRVIQAITGVRDGLPTCPANATTAHGCAYPDLGIHDTRHLMFFEPNALRNQLDFSPQFCEPFTEYPNIVFAPHTYTHSFTIDQQIFHWPINNTIYPPSFDFAYDNAVEEAAAMNAAVYVTEFGCGPDQDWFIMDGIVTAQDKHVTGGTMWSWKGNCMSQQGCSGSWGLYQSPLGQYPSLPQNGPINANRERILSRVYPRRIAGGHFAYGYDAAKMTFSLGAVATEATSNCDGDACVTEIFVPHLLARPAVVVKGSATASNTVNPDNTTTISVRVTGTGAYSIGIASYASIADDLATNALAAAQSRASSGVPAEERRSGAPGRALADMMPTKVLEGFLVWQEQTLAALKEGQHALRVHEESGGNKQ